MEDRRAGFVLLGKVGDAARARLLAARLESEGIETRVHGEGVGPYGFTVGQMAVTELWVPPDRLDDAKEVMLAAEVDDTLGADFAEPEDVPDWTWWSKAIALVIAGLIVALAVHRFLLAVG